MTCDTHGVVAEITTHEYETETYEWCAECLDELITNIDADPEYENLLSPVIVAAQVQRRADLE
jgi:hypothetical protein